jgi:hypothetical protein
MAIAEEKTTVCPVRLVANSWDPVAQRELNDTRCVLAVGRNRWDKRSIKMIRRETGKSFRRNHSRGQVENTAM